MERGVAAGPAGRVDRPAGREPVVARDRVFWGVLAGAALLQALLFHDHYSMSLTLLVSLGIGLWLRSWTAAGWALAAFLVAYVLALVTGWLHDARLVADTLLGAGLAFGGGLIGGGIFDVARRDEGIRAATPRWEWRRARSAAAGAGRGEAFGSGPAGPEYRAEGAE